MLRATLLATFAFLIATSCRERPEECQRLRQCCTAAQASGGEIEGVHVACTRKDDDQAALCRRRVEEVVAAVPSLSDNEACRLPPTQ